MGYRVYGEPEEKDSPFGSFFLGIFISLIAFINFGWIPVALGWANNRTMFFLFLLLGFILGVRWALDSWQRLKTPTKQKGKTHV